MMLYVDVLRPECQKYAYTYFVVELHIQTTSERSNCRVLREENADVTV